MSRNRFEDPLDRIGDISDACDRRLLLFFHRHPRTVLTSERLALYVGYEPSQVAKSVDALTIRGLLTRVQRPTTNALMYVLTLDGPRGDECPEDPSGSRPASSDRVPTMSRALDTVLEALRGGPLCVSCIARSAGTTAPRVLSALAGIGRQAGIVEEFRPCAGCGVLGYTHATVAPATRPTDLSGSSILVVDDHEDTMDLYADVLEHAGAIVQRATNLLEALNLFQQVDIDVVVTDIAMPGGSGRDILRDVRMRAPGVPVVAVTGQVIPGGRELVDHGFAAALLKPIDPADLVAVVGNLIRHERRA